MRPRPSRRRVNYRGSAVAEGGYQSGGIPHQIGMAKRKYIAVIRVIPTCRATIASHVRSEHVKARRSQRQHDLAPTVCDLRISMEEKEARPSNRLETGFQYVESETVDIGHVAGANAGGKREWSKFRRVGLNDCRARDLRLHECAGSCCGGGQNFVGSSPVRFGCYWLRGDLVLFARTCRTSPLTGILQLNPRPA
jgi:hypothetical protein